MPSKIRLSTADETELASELTDEVPIQQGESLTPVIYIPSPISPVLLRFRLMCAAGKPVSRSTFFELRIDCYTSCHSAKLRDLQKHLLNYARRVMNNLSRKNRKVIFLSLWRLARFLRYYFQHKRFQKDDSSTDLFIPYLKLMPINTPPTVKS